MTVCLYRLWLVAEIGVTAAERCAALRQQPGVRWARVVRVRWGRR